MVVVGVDMPAGGGDRRVTLTARVANPAKWSAEDPNLYSLVLELLAPDGRVVHTAAQAVGFREIEVRDKQLLVNGKRILVKGVNRAETDPDTGRYNTRNRQRDDVFLMKRLHINAVRTSHYPSDPYLYDLANRHGCGSPTRSTSSAQPRLVQGGICPPTCRSGRGVRRPLRPWWPGTEPSQRHHVVNRQQAGLGRAHFAMAACADANEPNRCSTTSPRTTATRRTTLADRGEYVDGTATATPTR